MDNRETLLRLRIPYSAACVLVVAALTAACSGTAASRTDAAGDEAATEVQVAPVSVGHLNRTVQVSGALAADQQAVLSMRVPGRVEALAIDLGSTVRTGQALARLEQIDYTLRVAQAEAALRQARARLGLSDEGDDDRVVAEETAIVRQQRAVLDEATLTAGRIRAFFARGISSRADVESAEAALKVAESRHQDALEEVRNRQAILAQRRAEVALSRAQLAATVLTAPFDGQVLDRPVEVGQYLAAGTPVATIVRVDVLRLRAEIPEREARSVRVGQPVRVTMEQDARVYSGTLARVSPAISSDNRTLLIEAAIRNEPALLRPGSFVRAEIIVEPDVPALLMPSSAVVSFAGVDKVFVVEGGKTVERRVTLGRREAESVEVIDGVANGDQVVMRPDGIVGGQAVRVASR
jgi:RND family efflux transporter MFP subunit